MKYCFVYKVTNQLNNKCYVGYHITKNLGDGYLGSGTYIKRAVEKIGKDNFTRTILEHCSTDNVLEREQYWIKKLNVRSPNGYNLTDGGDGSLGRILSEETKRKIGKKSKGRIPSKETRLKMSKAQKGKKLSKESIRKRTESRKGLTYSDESKKKISESQKKRLANPENNGMFGRTHSEESIKKMRERAKNRKRQTCEYCGMNVVTSMYVRWHGDNCKKKGAQ